MGLPDLPVTEGMKNFELQRRTKGLLLEQTSTKTLKATEKIDEETTRIRANQK